MMKKLYLILATLGCFIGLQEHIFGMKTPPAGAANTGQKTIPNSVRKTTTARKATLSDAQNTQPARLAGKKPEIGRQDKNLKISDSELNRVIEILNDIETQIPEQKKVKLDTLANMIQDANDGQYRDEYLDQISKLVHDSTIDDKNKTYLLILLDAKKKILQELASANDPIYRQDIINRLQTERQVFDLKWFDRLVTNPKDDRYDIVNLSYQQRDKIQYMYQGAIDALNSKATQQRQKYTVDQPALDVNASLANDKNQELQTSQSSAVDAQDPALQNKIDPSKEPSTLAEIDEGVFPNKKMPPLPEWYRGKKITSGKKKSDTPNNLSDQELDSTKDDNNIQPARQRAQQLNRIGGEIETLINATKNGDLRVQNEKLLDLALTTNNSTTLSELLKVHGLNDVPQIIKNVATARRTLHAINKNQSLEKIILILDEAELAIAQYPILDTSLINNPNNTAMQNLLQEIRNKQQEVQFVLKREIDSVNDTKISTITGSTTKTLDEKITELEKLNTEYNKDSSYNKSDTVIELYKNTIAHLKTEKKEKVIVELLSQDIGALKKRSNSAWASFLAGPTIKNRQPEFQEYCSLTLTILAKRGSLAKETIKSAITSLFSSSPNKVAQKTEDAVIEQASATAPAQDSSPQTIAQWITSVTNMISDAMFGKKSGRVAPSAQELDQGLLPEENRL